MTNGICRGRNLLKIKVVIAFNIFGFVVVRPDWTNIGSVNLSVLVSHSVGDRAASVELFHRGRGPAAAGA